MDTSYIINQLGEDREKYFNALAPPIMQTSNFVFNTVEEMRLAFENEYDTYIYSRGKNPTVDILKTKLAALDGAEDCLVFNSGAAAIFAAILANVKAGDHVVSVNRPYTWAQNMFNVILPRFGVTTSYIDGTDIENFERAILPNTTLIYLESPNSWDFALQDLTAVAELAKAEGIMTICDNSYCTPLYQQPIVMGIDIAIQSATKYIGGHGDTVAGVLSGSKEMINRIFNSEYMNIGSGIQPLSAWLLIRGLRTLPIRLEHITHSTKKVVAFLKQHPKVEKVIFTFDEDFPQYELAKQQMKGACGLLTFIIKADTVLQIEIFCEGLKHVYMAVSWGGHESLIMARCSTIKRADFNAKDPDHRMLRFYVGLEDPDYLIADLEQAFEKMS
ncbi:MAG: aminotransferase class I/II-fold pyridoxal phosphate-dependent enzyme [Ferruginibacter sp.]